MKKNLQFAFAALFIIYFSPISSSAQSWNTTGNSGTTAGTNFIGTTDAKDFVFKTNGVEKGRVKSNGLWQFGASGNLAKIDSAGNLTFTGAAVYKVGGNKYAFQYSGNANYGLFFNSTDLRYEFRDVNAAPVAYFNSNAIGNAYIKGNTGIGTTSPSGKLHVKGNSNVSQLIIDANATQSNINPLIKLRSSTGADLMWISADDTSNLFIGVNAGSVNSVSGYGTDNTFIGNNSGRYNTIGFWNTATGSHALRNNTDGNFNTANGVEALYANTSGYQNTAMGVRTLYSNTTGGNNTAVGWHTMYLNTTGVYNVAMGNGALFANSTGYANTALGYSALSYNSTGYENTAVGQNALYSSTTGYANSAFGFESLKFNTTGSNNVAIGHIALRENTSGSSNTACGIQSLQKNTQGFSNAGFGYQSLYNNTNGNSNTAIGGAALYYNTEGYLNVAVGYGAGLNIVTGYDNACFGNGANTSVDGLVYGTAIGDGAVVNASSKVRIGRTGTTVIEGQVAYSYPSDGRFKENVKEDVQGLDFIMKLQPVSYNFNRVKYAQHVNEVITPEYEKTLMEESQNRSVGFIAQDVEKIIQQTGFTSFDAVHPPTNETDNYSMGYSEFVVPLVKAVQELDSMNTDLKTSNEELKTQNENLNSKVNAQQKQIDDLKILMQQFDYSLSQCCMNYQQGTQPGTQNSKPETPLLEQNVPNPFSQNTIIKYYLPQSTKSGMIKIYSLDGVDLKSFSISQSGFGQVTVSGSSLTSGVYVYTLLVDGKVVETKQMILTRE